MSLDNMVTPENNGASNGNGSTENNNVSGSTNGSNNETSSTVKPNHTQTLPQTGDESNIILLGIAALVSIAGIILMRKKDK